MIRPEWRSCLLALALLGLWLVSACTSQDGGEAPVPRRPLGHLDTVEVIAERAPVWADGEQGATVERGRRFGVIAEDTARVKVQVCEGTDLCRGWIARGHVRFLRDRDIDLAEEALGLSAALDAELDIEAYKARLAALADRVAAAAAGGTTPRERIRLANQEVFGREGFRAGDIGVNVLDIVVDKKQGSCLGLSVLYLCATRELDLPLYLVRAPRHVFVRYDDGRVRFNIETTTGGTIHESDDYLVEHLGHSLSQQAGGVDQLTLANARVLGLLHVQRAQHLLAMGKHSDACHHFARALEVNPLDVSVLANWAVVLLATDEVSDAMGLCARALEINPRYARGHLLMGRALTEQLRWREACEHFASAIRDDPPHDVAQRAYIAWANTLVLLHDFDGAHVEFAAVASYDPDSAEFWYGLANLAKRIGEQGGTAQDFETALRARHEAARRDLLRLLNEEGR